MIYDSKDFAGKLVRFDEVGTPQIVVQGETQHTKLEVEFKEKDLKKVAEDALDYVMESLGVSLNDLMKMIEFYYKHHADVEFYDKLCARSEGDKDGKV